MSEREMGYIRLSLLHATASAKEPQNLEYMYLGHGAFAHVCMQTVAEASTDSLQLTMWAAVTVVAARRCR